MNQPEPPITDLQVEELQARNAQRSREAIQKLGDKWLLHPSAIPRPRNAPPVLLNQLRTHQ